MIEICVILERTLAYAHIGKYENSLIHYHYKTNLALKESLGKSTPYFIFFGLHCGNHDSHCHS